MRLIDEINSLRQQGYNDGQIIETLQERGASPREINDAISRSKVKSAIYEDDFSGMQPGISDEVQEEIPQPEQEYNQNYNQEYPEQQDLQDQGYQGNYPQQDYDKQYSQTDTISDIVNQIVDEKLSKLNSKINPIIESKTLINSQVEKIDERLKKIESIIDQLQMTLIRKAAQQEENIEDIKSEMELIEEGIGKLVSSPKSKVKKSKK